MTRRDRQAQRQRRRRRFDPMQRANDFVTEPAPRTETLSIERRVALLSNMAKNAVLLASKPPGRQLLETVLELPEASQLDVGRQIILRSGPGIADRIYIGIQLGDDSYAWVESTTELSVAAKTFVRHIGLSSPYGIGFDPTGSYFLVTDRANHHISKVTTGGTGIWTVGEYSTTIVPGSDISGDPNPNMTYPQSVVHRSGSDWAAATSQDTNFIGVFREGDGFTATWRGSYGTAQGPTGSIIDYSNIQQMCFDGSFNLYICDASNHRICVRHPNRNAKTSFGTLGSGNNNFNLPAGVAHNPRNGYLYIADFSNHRVKIHTTSGTYIDQFGGSGSGDAQFTNPGWLAFDNQGYLHVVDSGNDRVQVFDEDGNFLTKYGSSGSGAGQFGQPWAISISANGIIVITDLTNARVSVWV